MQRKLYILAFALLLCLIALLTSYPFDRSIFFRRTPSQYQQTVVQSKEKAGRRAYATMICKPEMVEPTLVSIYSLKGSTNPTGEVIVLLPEAIPFSNETISQLRSLGTQILWTTPSLEDPCDSMIHLWSLNYDKIVYFTSHVLFSENADRFFDYKRGSVIVPSLPNHQGPSLLILEPQSEVYNTLLQQYRSSGLSMGDFLDHHYADPNAHILPEHVNESITLFGGSMQPWNFHQYSGVNWRDYYDPVSFYQWRRKANELHQSLFESEWANQARQQTVCDRYQNAPHQHHTEGYPVKDKFSVLLSTYNPERIEHLSLLIQHLLRSNYVHTVFITWHNPALEVPASLLEGVKDASRVKILPQEFDSLNNRFNPVAELQTEAVYILDDDIFVDLKDLAFTFKVWQSRKDSVVGHFPRYHSYDPETYKAVYKVPFRENKYSMVLTKSMFIHSDYLFAYTCVLDSALHHHVDNILNCEDISFSMMASGLSAAGPLAVLPNRPISDFGLKNGISTNSGHMPARSQCVSDLITHFWNKQDPLIYAQESVIPYRRPTLRRGSWSGIRSQLRSYRNN